MPETDALRNILDVSGNAIYALQALTALYGVYCVVILTRRIAQKRFGSQAAADEFLDESRNLLRQNNIEGLVELCDSPPFWAKVTPQLILVGLQNRDQPLAKLRRLLAEKFEREVLADLEYRLSWIATVVKVAPMLGLLGTVVGMIAAFQKLAGASVTGGTDPSQLAEDISFALLTTMYGLMIAIPLIMAGEMIHVRIGKLQDSVQEQIGIVLDDLSTSGGGS